MVCGAAAGRLTRCSGVSSSRLPAFKSGLSPEFVVAVHVWLAAEELQPTGFETATVIKSERWSGLPCVVFSRAILAL